MLQIQWFHIECSVQRGAGFNPTKEYNLLMSTPTRKRLPTIMSNIYVFILLDEDEYHRRRAQRSTVIFSKLVAEFYRESNAQCTPIYIRSGYLLQAFFHSESK